MPSILYLGQYVIIGQCLVLVCLTICYSIYISASVCRYTITNGHLLFVMGALILQRAQKCEVRQVTKDVVKSEV